LWCNTIFWTWIWKMLLSYLNEYCIFMNGISMLAIFLIVPWLLLLIFPIPSVWIRTSSLLYIEYGDKWKYGFISYGSSLQYSLRTQWETSSFVCMHESKDCCFGISTTPVLWIDDISLLERRWSFPAYNWRDQVYGCDICFQVLVNIWFNLNFPIYLTFGYNTFKT